MSNLIIPNEKAAYLRQLAASLELKMRRGVGAKEIGSLPALMSILADCYNAEPERVERLIRQALRMDEEWCVCQMPKHECICEQAPKGGAIVV